jgi:hypothetical protein
MSFAGLTDAVNASVCLFFHMYEGDMKEWMFATHARNVDTSTFALKEAALIQATRPEDMVFYGSGLYEPQTQSYADANHSNARCIDACPDSPGAVWMEENGYPRDTGDGR